MTSLTLLPFHQQSRRVWAFGLLMGLICATLGQTANAQSSRPNIVLVLTDDQGWNGTSVMMDPDVPDSKSSFYETPNLETLAAKGLRFSSGYASASLCAPTRAAIQTGMSPAQLQYTELIEIANPNSSRFQSTVPGMPLTPPMPLGLSPEGNGLSPSAQTLARWLGQHAPEYRTAHMGKWHMGSINPLEAGYDVAEDPPSYGQNIDPWSIFSMTDRTNDFMTESAAAGDPFFVQVSHRAVHDPIRTRPGSAEIFRDREPDDRHDDARYAGMTYDLDAGLGKIMEHIEELGIEDNTYIIYASDNGPVERYSDAAPLFRGKVWLYEGGVRVPFIVSGPGITPGSVSDVPVSTTDLFATVSQLAGISTPLPAGHEGASLVPLLQNAGQLPAGEESLVRAYGENGELFFHYPHNFGVRREGRIPPHSAVRAGDYKLVRIYGEHGEADELLLFNLAENVEESAWNGSELNLADDMPELAADLNNRLERWIQGVDASLPYDVKENIVLDWQANSPGDVDRVWRSVVDVDYLARERWEMRGKLQQPELVETKSFQPQLADAAFRFDGDDGMERKYFDVSDLNGRRSSTNTGTPDEDRSASFEFWVRLADLQQSHLLLEAGDERQGLSFTLGDADKDGQHDELRMRTLSDDGQHLALTVDIDDFANPERDFVHLVGILDDSNESRAMSLYVNGAQLGRVEGALGEEGSIRWDSFDNAGLGSIGGEGLGAAGGGGPLPFNATHLKGDLAGVRYFNYAIDESDVQAHYQSVLSRPSAGIDDSTGQFVIPDVRPSDTREGELESNNSALVFHERNDVADEPIYVDLIPAAGAEYGDADLLDGDGEIEAGTEFSSFLIHFDPKDQPGKEAHVSGSVTFAEPILGVIFEDATLLATDRLLTTVGRLEVEDRAVNLGGADALGFSQDLKTLTATLAAIDHDIVEFRILTASASDILPELAGDYNGDGAVDQGDLDLVLLNWGDDATFPPTGWVTNHPDGRIDQNEFDQILLNWGNRVTVSPLEAGAPVPEPQAWLLGLLTAVAAWVIGNRRLRQFPGGSCG